MRAESLRAFWKDIGFVPGPFMDIGMTPRRAAWLDRMTDRISASGATPQKTQESHN
jgi:hypothetical protein